jgi:chromosome segregation ATPase
MSEYVGCHECGPECPDDCGCRASDATLEAEVARLRQSRDTWERVEAETRAEMHTRLAEHRDAVEVLKLRLSEVAAERDRARSVAVALEAEVERLRAGIEERVVGWSSYRTDPASLTAASRAESLRRLLTPPDAQEPAQEPRTGAGGPGVPDEGCEAVSGQQWAVVEAPLDGGE